MKLTKLKSYYNEIKKKIFPRKFSESQIELLKKYEISKEIATKYDKRFSLEDLIILKVGNCLPEIANLYDERLDSGVMEFILNSKGIDPKTANSYDERFSYSEILRLNLEGIDSNNSNSYDVRFDVIEIYGLNMPPKVPSEIANQYDSKLTALTIMQLFPLGLKPGEIQYESNKKKLIEILENQDICFNPLESRENEEIKFIATGSEGLIMFYGDGIFKFSKNFDFEIELLKKISKRFSNKQKNIIKLTPNSKESSLEFILGDSLENKLKNQTYASKKILKYGAQIMNGLIEMRTSGIFYHRDLRPANIMIDDLEDNAVIIDFGIATENRKSFSKNNRRYGGENDLISLGQIMYKMATDEHIFTESKSMDETIYANKIKDQRNLIYQDRDKLNLYLEKVDQNISDENLANLIKNCLTSKSFHYGKIQRKFHELTHK